MFAIVLCAAQVSLDAPTAPAKASDRVGVKSDLYTLSKISSTSEVRSHIGA